MNGEMPTNGEFAWVERRSEWLTALEYKGGSSHATGRQVRLFDSMVEPVTSRTDWTPRHKAGFTRLADYRETPISVPGQERFSEGLGGCPSACRRHVQELRRAGGELSQLVVGSLELDGRCVAGARRTTPSLCRVPHR